MSALTTRDALAKALAAHRIVYEQDGDFGEKQWIACSCSHLSFGDDYWTGETEEDHERHVAANLPVIDAATLADDRAIWDRVCGAIAPIADKNMPGWDAGEMTTAALRALATHLGESA